MAKPLPKSSSSLDDLFVITCGRCQHTAPVMNWRFTEISGELPAGMFQCPQCGHAFKRQPQPQAKPWDKFIVLVPAQTHL